jgi:hypothetical protein
MLTKVKKKDIKIRGYNIMPDKGKSKSASTKNNGKKTDKKNEKNKGPKK